MKAIIKLMINPTAIKNLPKLYFWYKRIQFDKEIRNIQKLHWWSKIDIRNLLIFSYICMNFYVLSLQ